MTEDNGQSESRTLVRPGQVPAELLRVTIDPARIANNEAEAAGPLGHLLGQDRAAEAMAFGAAIRQPGFNIFVMGRAGSGRRTALLDKFASVAAGRTPPGDWVYVHNFEDERRPRALRLPTGVAAEFRREMRELVDELVITIPAAFESEDYKSRRGALDETRDERKETRFEEFDKRVRAEQIAILRSPIGFALAPTRNGEVVKPEVFRTWSEADRTAVEKKIETFQEELAQIVQREFPSIEKEHRKAVRELDHEVAMAAIGVSVAELRKTFGELPPILAHLDAVEADLIENVRLFVSLAAAAEQGFAPEQLRAEPALRRYDVNVMVSAANDGGGGASVVEEAEPTLGNLLGRIEHRPTEGALVTDFTLIKPGALHRANGGFLVIDAREILAAPFAWQALKRALKTGVIHMSSVAEQMSLISTVSLEPEEIPLDLKVALIGDRRLYYLISELDPDFGELFKVSADFEDEVDRTEESTTLMARELATVAGRAGLRPLAPAGMARLLEHASRVADDSLKFSLLVDQVIDVAREADFRADAAGAATIDPAHVTEAIEARSRRAERIRLRNLESMTREIVSVATDGEAVGQINGLSVISFGDVRFGRPSRITARTRIGAGKVVDIEREVELGGPLHSKGVLILQSFLATRYGGAAPMSLWASLVFEQSYGGVDGDSASSAELYALLSSLSGAAIRQSLAVTGSVDQFGRVQAIGGVNEKIEGFFDLCAARGLTGDQGVLIPLSNVQHLNLRADVAEAASAGRFAVHAVDHVDQGLALLTGLEAGEPDAAGAFPPDSVNGRVAARLAEFAEARRKFGGDGRGARDGGGRK